MPGSAAEIIAVRELLEHADGEITSVHPITDGEGELTGKIRQAFRDVVTSGSVPED